MSPQSIFCRGKRKEKREKKIWLDSSGHGFDSRLTWTRRCLGLRHNFDGEIGNNRAISIEILIYNPLLRSVSLSRIRT